MSLFPEPTTADQIASVDYLRKDARQKIHLAAKARDLEAANYWRRELERLTKLRAAVVNRSQLDFTAAAPDLFDRRQEPAP